MPGVRKFSTREKNRSLSCFCTVAKKVPTQYEAKPTEWFAGLKCTCSEHSGKSVLDQKRSRPRRYEVVALRKTKDAGR